MSHSWSSSRSNTTNAGQPNNSMSEAGPSRIQYPPAAVLASTSKRTRKDIAEESVLPSNSSSSLFWRGDLQQQFGQGNTNETRREGSTDIPGPNQRRPSSRYNAENDLVFRNNRRTSVVSAIQLPVNLERARSVSTIGPASIASSKSVVGGFVNWFSGRTNRAAARAEAGKRLGKKLKRAEDRARRKKQMAGRDLNPLDNDRRQSDSDSDIVIAMEESMQRPPLDVPPPNAPTANALSRVASKGGTKAPKLHFAPEEQKIRKKYLPQDYEIGELYRGLDDYVQASRDRRRRAKRREKKRGSRVSSRSSVSKSSISSGDSSSTSSDSDDGKSNSSGSSSSSSASGRLTMARLRAFFGDSSSSGSSSSSSSSSTTSSSTSSKSGSSDTDSSHSATSKGTFGLFRKRRASRASLDSDAESNVPATPRTPARHFQIRGGAERRRKRKAVQRYRAQEKRLIEEGKIPPKPSRKARKLAKLAQEQAGGITEYTLFTPIALAADAGQRKHRHHTNRPSLDPHAFTEQRVDLKEVKVDRKASAERVLQTVSFAAVKDRLHALRRFRRQIENAGGDIGVREVDTRTGIDESHLNRDEDIEEKAVDLDEFDLEDGDLALPPPALELPQEVKSLSSSRKIKDWHMSDVPLTPHIQMATDFARGFEVNSTTKKSDFHPTLATQREDGAIPDTGQTPPSDAPSSSRTNVAKMTSSGTSLTAGSPRNGEAHAAWWLDINCPTYRDMSELSRMFPLHPLTVEDILQQDTREKVEVFEKLNYYFVVVRAIDEKYFKFTPATSHHSTQVKSKGSSEKLKSDYLQEDSGIEMTEIDKKAGQVQIVERPGQQEGLEGVSVGAINIYLIVFSHGVISFHFEDVSNHTDRIRSRLLDLTQPVELTSDWIAHGMFDSIVDSFFPLLKFLQTEIEEIEMLTDETLPRTRRETVMAQRKKRLVAMEKIAAAKVNSLPSYVTHEKREREVFRFMPQLALSTLAVHVLPSVLVTRRTHLIKKVVPDPASLPRKSLIQRIFNFKRFGEKATSFHSNSASDQKIMLRRITDTRKIVTGLSRLLAPKNDSVRGLRKRLVDLRTPSISTTEMSIYMGDVHDHIVTMLSHLSSNDYRLNDIHSTYLSTIRMANSLSSHSKDEILIILATVTVTIIFTVFTTSLFSFNVGVPMNVHFTSNHHWFGGIVAFAGLIPVATIFTSRTLMKQAKEKTAARRAGR